jgi:hypothetical protein
MIFMIFYKGLWVIVVAYPLWKAGTLAGTPAGEMARVFFLSAVVGLVIVPWVYVFKNFVLPSKSLPTARIAADIPARLVNQKQGRIGLQKNL